MLDSQDSSQKVVLIVLFLCVIFIIVKWYIYYDCSERYSPYRNTGGINSSETGYKYLDEYEGQQYYKNNPWIYPTPTSYTRLLYANERDNMKYLEKQRKVMLEKLNSLDY